MADPLSLDKFFASSQTCGREFNPGGNRNQTGRPVIPIKIHCSCGQRYAFDVEPVNGRMPSPVACPACGGDGTIVANEAIAAALGLQPAAGPVVAPVVAV